MSYQGCEFYAELILTLEEWIGSVSLVRFRMRLGNLSTVPSNSLDLSNSCCINESLNMCAGRLKPPIGINKIAYKSLFKFIITWR